MRGIVQHPDLGKYRMNIKHFAAGLRRARISARGQFGEPLIALLISPQDRDMLLDVLHTMAEVVIEN